MYHTFIDLSHFFHKVDPNKMWKFPWRWYDEDMLEQYFSVDIIKKDGITFDQFTDIAKHNSLNLKVNRMNKGLTIDQFRETLKEICTGENKVLVCSYSRESLRQTGDGHFSPIGKRLNN